MCFGPEVAAALALWGPYVAAATSAAAGAAGVGATIYGGVQQSHAASQQAQAIAEQNRATMAAQNQAFTERQAAARAQTNAQFAAGQRAVEASNTNADATRIAQSGALQRQQDTLDAENRTADTLRARGDQTAQELIAQTARPNLDAAQTGYQTAQAALLAPSLPTGPEPTDPGGPAPGTAVSTSTSDPVTKTALARRMGIAAANIRQYGADIARVGSYGQPLQAVGQAISANEGGIMPIESAAKLLAGGANVRLLPSQVAYSNATDLGRTTAGVIGAQEGRDTNLAALGFGNATTIANQGQSDADVRAANVARQATADADWQKQIGGLISGLGNVASYGSGLYGGSRGFNLYNQIGGTGTPYNPAVNMTLPQGIR